MQSQVLFSSLLLIGWLTVIVLIALAAVPLNPVSINFERKMNILSVVPEGWGFFTRNAREPALYMYSRGPDGYRLCNKSMADPENLMGLSRKSRKRNMELFTLLRSIPDRKWQVGTKGSLQMQCDSTFKIKGIMDHSTVRGEFLIVKQERIPWAWARNDHPVVMPYKKILLTIY